MANATTCSREEFPGENTIIVSYSASGVLAPCTDSHSVVSTGT